MSGGAVPRGAAGRSTRPPTTTTATAQRASTSARVRVSVNGTREACRERCDVSVTDQRRMWDSSSTVARLDDEVDELVRHDDHLARLAAVQVRAHALGRPRERHEL